MDISEGLLLLMMYRMVVSEINVMDSQEERCYSKCRPWLGEFCLGSQCVQCSYCPEDPFDVDQRGRLIVYKPCIRYGFCPKICSSYLGLGSHPRANNTLCQKIKKPKVTEPRTTQPVSTTVYETTTIGSTYGTVKITSGRTYISTSQVIPTTNPTEEFLTLGYIAGGIFLLPIFVYASVKLKRKIKCCNKQPSAGNDIKVSVRKYAPLKIRLDHQNKTVTVTGLKGLNNCNALQLCACLFNPCNSVENWMLTNGLDEVELPGVMIPRQVYPYKAGRVTASQQFECITQGKITTEEIVNDTLDEACSTTLKDIFGNISLRRSLEIELNCSSQRDMTDIIATALELTEDQGKGFKGHRCLGRLYDEPLTTNDMLDSSIHPMMERLAWFNEAKDFVRKIAKRETTRYCKKCLELLHRMCCRSLDYNSEVVSENSALMVGSCAV